MSIAGVLVPTTRAIDPSTAAMEYAGAVESSPMATPSQKVMASPLSPLSSWPRAASPSLVMTTSA